MKKCTSKNVCGIFLFQVHWNHCVSGCGLTLSALEYEKNRYRIMSGPELYKVNSNATQYGTNSANHHAFTLYRWRNSYRLLIRWPRYVIKDCQNYYWELITDPFKNIWHFISSQWVFIQASTFRQLKVKLQGYSSVLSPRPVLGQAALVSLSIIPSSILLRGRRQ